MFCNRLLEQINQLIAEQEIKSEQTYKTFCDLMQSEHKTSTALDKERESQKMIEVLQKLEEHVYKKEKELDQVCIIQI